MKKSFIFSMLLFAPLPMILLIGVYNFHLFISSLYCFTASCIFGEIIQGIPTREEYACVEKGTTAVIPAYLPNEQGIIFDTIQHYIDSTNFEKILVVYNTPHYIPEVEERLFSLMEVFNRLEVVKVPNSVSKADNLNYILDEDLVKTDYLAIFDADHRPEREALQYALTWLYEGYCAVQGRCVVYNRENWVAKIIAPEFDLIYRLLHNSRFRITGTGIFGGSNCYWNTEVLSNYRLNPVMTEDIDLSLRVLSDGHKIAHDPNVVSLEEAPTTLKSLWKQRVRWSLGWSEVTLALSKKIVFSKHTTLVAKVYWLYNLIYREVFSFFNFSIFFVLAAYQFIDVPEFNFFFQASFGFTLVALTCYAMICSSVCKYKNYKFLYFPKLLSSYPFTTFKSLVTVQGWTKLLVRDNTWIPTKRG